MSRTLHIASTSAPTGSWSVPHLQAAAPLARRGWVDARAGLALTRIDAGG